VKALKFLAHVCNVELNLKLSEDVMRYTPYSETEIKSMNVIDAGTYPFQVADVETTKNGHPMSDRNGNEMCKLKLTIWDSENRERIVYTYITGDDNFAYKLRHFAKTIGMIKEYDNGTLNMRETVGRQGTAEIVIKKGTLKTDGSGEMWADRNDVKDFTGEPQAQSNSSAGGPPRDRPHATDERFQDLPF